MPRKRPRKPRQRVQAVAGIVTASSEIALSEAETTIAPTCERYRHGDIIEPEETMRAGIFRQRVRSQTMLDRYFLRHEISQDQHDAGMRLHRDWRLSGCEPRITGNYSGVLFDGGRSDFTQVQLDARDRLEAVQHSIGELCMRILAHVCFWDFSAKDWALKRGMRENVARVYGAWLLKDALDMLAEHYKRRR